MKYYKYKIENLIKVNKIVTVHYLEFDNPFTNKPEHHNFWELVYAEKNGALCYRNGKYYNLNEGEIIFHKPNELHSLKIDNSKSNVVVVSFDCKSDALHYFEDKILKISKENAKILYNIIKESKRTFNIPYSNPNTRKMPILDAPTLGGLQLIKNYLEVFLINVIRENTEIDGINNTFIVSSQAEGVSKNIIKYLEENVENRLSIDDIAKKLNYSKSYIFRKFKSQTGISIMSYFNDLKIKHAKKILEKTDLSVTEISNKLSFDSQSYFTKTFKKSTNYSPLKYRKFFREK